MLNTIKSLTTTSTSFVNVLLLTLLLSACGGGGSSNSGGGSSIASAGRYIGQFSIVATPANLPQAQATQGGSATIDITAQGQLTIRLNNGGVIFGAVNSNGSFLITENAARATGDGNCTQGNIVIDGIADTQPQPNQVRASITANGLVCGGNAVNLRGSITANKVAG